MNTDTFMCSSDESRPVAHCRCIQNTSGWKLSFRAPHIMPTSHWHGQVEVNVPFDGDVEY